MQHVCLPQLTDCYVVLQFNRHFCWGKRHRMFVWAKFEKWVDKGGYSGDTDTKENWKENTGISKREKIKAKKGRGGRIRKYSQVWFFPTSKYLLLPGNFRRYRMCSCLQETRAWRAWWTRPTITAGTGSRPRSGTGTKHLCLSLSLSGFDSSVVCRLHCASGCDIFTRVQLLLQ